MTKRTQTMNTTLRKPHHSLSTPLCSLGLCVLICAAALNTRAENASEQFSGALTLLTQAESARDEGKNKNAIALFEKAFEQYMTLSEKYPTWQPQVTRFRMNYAKDQRQLLLRRGGWLAPSDKPTVKRPGPNLNVGDLPGLTEATSTQPPTHHSATHGAKQRVRELIHAGDGKGARAVLMDALMKAPDDLELRILTATAQCLDAQYDDAMFILDELALDQPKNTDIVILKAAAFTGMGDLEAARKHLEQALALNADLHAAHFNLAGIYLAQTPPDLDMALAHYERAIKLGAEPDVGIATQVGYEDVGTTPDEEIAEP